MPVITFRPAHASDAPVLSGLIGSFLSEFTVNPDGSGAEPFLASVSADAEAGYIADSRYHYVVAEQDGALAGFAATRDQSHLFALFVARACQGLGLGRLLWQRVASAAMAMRDFELFTLNATQRALPVYQRFGFEAVASPVQAHGICFVPMQAPVTRVQALLAMPPGRGGLP